MDNFASRLIAWQKQHGRKGLPWQNTQDPYRVWLSEIMLQQTQVVTVIDYYQRFLQRFPTVADLAAAHEDEVMQLWAGLGYYSRARNLHKAAQMVMQDFGGEFPQTAEALCKLPGVGMSTAAAIAAFCYGERAAIFDANVARVLARVLAFDADLAIAKNKNALWATACELLPRDDLHRNMPAYTQGLMDLGATVCTARQPQCGICPFAMQCQAKVQGRELSLPLRTKKLQRQSIDMYLHWQVCAGKIALSKRPAQGIWGGLYCLPQISSDAFARLAEEQGAEILPPIKHVLTHRDLHLHIVRQVSTTEKNADENLTWCSASQCLQLGLPQPIAKLIQTLNK